MEFVKRFAEMLPFLEPYPVWVKVLVGAWVALSAVLILCFVFVHPSPIPVSSVQILGRVVTSERRPVSTAAVEFVLSDYRTDTVTDSEGEFVLVTSVRNRNTARLRIAASGYRTYERNLKIDTETRDLGTFTLQRDPQSTKMPPARFNPTEVGAATDAFNENVQTWYEGADPSTGDMYAYLDSVAVDAQKLASVWFDLARELNANPDVDMTNAELMRETYQAYPPANLPPFSNLFAQRQNIPNTLAQRVGMKWASQYTAALEQTITARESARESLSQYLSSTTGTVSERERAASYLKNLNTAVIEMQNGSASLRAVAKAARADFSPHRTRTTSRGAG